ncbi:MAG TPA: hydantoinase/oxoprolinase family protein [Anaerolineae bacterium]|nr:hydantoinase/oxoprolinase family protein [Anaerolineae bacterium]
MYRLGIDIGGTFTDATLINENTGATRIAKVPSTPHDPSIAFLRVTERILRETNVAPQDVRYVVHGTTVATNAIIEGKIARTGLLTTEGFRDILELARQIRPSLYDLQFEKPRPLVPRYLSFGIPERLDARGNILTPLDEASVRTAAEQLRREHVEAIAVCFLHSYLNPAHEKLAGEILNEVFPDAVISLSSEVAPEIREYTRASTTIINVSLRPLVSSYLQNIEQRLREANLNAELLVMQSSGGVFTFAAAREKPVFIVESGPAAGVIAAAQLGTALGQRNVLSLDMGGTTAKAGMIQDGTPRVTKDYEIGAVAQIGQGSARGSGYPIRTPVIDLVEIGAGGGSIAWVDSGGALRVGPQSAGADPGPACYAQGGIEPTITDANLVLGRINSKFFLGGEIELDAERARQAIQDKCARKLGLDVVAAAHGIIEIANAAMVNALRLVSVQRGYDPRDFVLIAFGGAGPLHANRLAAEMEIPTTIIPKSPGIFSALGLLVTDLKHDYARTMLQRTDAFDAQAIEDTFQKLEREGHAVLEREGIAPANRKFIRQVEMRYVGQSYELALPLPNHTLQAADLNALLAQFHRAHERAYGFSAPDEPTEFVNWRLTAMGKISKPELHALQNKNPDASLAQKETRPVFFAERGGYVDCPIYDRYRLGAGAVIPGPAIVEEFDSTTVIHPGFHARVDEYGDMFIGIK